MSIRQSSRAASTWIGIGYWHSSRQGFPDLPHPQGLVSPSWEPQRRAQIVRYLKSGHGFRAGALEHCKSGCRGIAWQRTDDPRLGVRRPELDAEDVCHPPGFWIAHDVPLTTSALELTDGVWCWPEEVAHYMEVHGVRLPDEFVAYAAARDFRPPTTKPRMHFRVQLEFWTDWCRKNARFEYEPECDECRSLKGAPKRIRPTL